MPAKRRGGKRRLDPAVELGAWASVFDSGYDFFNDLSTVGVEVDSYGRPARPAVEIAWRRLGANHLAERPAGETVPWAVAEFGGSDAG